MIQKQNIINKNRTIGRKSKSCIRWNYSRIISQLVDNQIIKAGCIGIHGKIINITKGLIEVCSLFRKAYPDAIRASYQLHRTVFVKIVHQSNMKRRVRKARSQQCIGHRESHGIVWSTDIADSDVGWSAYIRSGIWICHRSQFRW